MRIELYKASITTFFERPIFGYGYDKIFIEVQARSDLIDSRQSYTHLHNAFLNHLIAGGLVGLFVFLIFLLLPVFILLTFKERNNDNILFAILILANSFMSGQTNLYLRHDLLVSFNSILPIVLTLSMYS